MTTTVPKADYGKLRFLIADDKMFLRNLVQSMLFKAGANEVLHANDGAEATRMLETRGNSIDCIISDWNMAPVGGLELLRAVRAGEIRNLPIATCFVMLTGNASASVVNPAMALDVNAYLIKPVSFEKLTQTLDRALTREWRPKHADAYRTVGGLEVPPAMRDAGRSSPSVMWFSKAATSPRIKEQLKDIGCQAKELKAAPAGQEIRNVRRMDLMDIKQGAVLAEDMTSDDGALLVGTGTVLSEGLLARLRTLTVECGEQVKILVGDL